MRSLALYAVAVVLSPFTALAWAAEPNLSDATTAADLVERALMSELKGPSVARASLLAEALRCDPENASARWQSGYVEWNGRWRTTAELARVAAGNETLSGYRKWRDAMISTAENHQELAQWCHKNKLFDQERIHWAKVLEFEPDNFQAIAALGLQVYQGQVLSKDQIEDKKREAMARRALAGNVVSCLHGLARPATMDLSSTQSLSELYRNSTE